MQKNRSLIIIIIVIGAVLAWEAICERFIWPAHGWNSNSQLAGNNPATAPSTQPVLATQPTTQPYAQSSTEPSTNLSTAPSMTAAGLVAVPPQQSAAEFYWLGDRNPKSFRQFLQISGRGAGLDWVILNEAKAQDELGPYIFQKPPNDHPSERALAMRTLNVNGQSLSLGNLLWTPEKSNTPNTLALGLNVRAADGSPVCHITQTYAVAPTNFDDNTNGGYEVAVTCSIINTSHHPQTFSLEINGPTVPPAENDRYEDRLIVAGYDRGDRTLDVVRKSVPDFKTTDPGADITTEEKSNFPLLWAGAVSNYFTAVLRPDQANQIASVHVVAYNPESLPSDREISIRIATADKTLQPGESQSVPFKTFLAPKRRPLLEGAYYSSFPCDYQQLLSNATSIWNCGMCAPPWLIDGLIEVLRAFHFVLRDWGLAIMALVVIVRLCLHPITKSSQVSMMKMQKLAPEMERLKKKFADDKEGLTKAQMELYKQVGVSPLLGCLPMFLQMPIWIALYTGLQQEYALRQAPFLWGFTWIHDLSRPDRLVHWSANFVVPIINWKISAFNLIPILLAVVFYINQKMTPKPPAATPEQAQQQKMMQFMSLLFPLFLYSAPSGLNLYIFASTGFGILESKRIRAHIKEREDAERDGRVIIDAKPTRGGKKKIADDTPAKLGIWERMRKRIAEIQEQAERERKKKK